MMTPNLPPPLTAEAFAQLGAPSLVYVRELPEGEAAMIAGGQKGLKFFAICAADGTRVGVVGPNRDSAFATALQHELVPTSVH